eukprot:6001445-Amphidinium_carterae.1
MHSPCRQCKGSETSIEKRPCACARAFVCSPTSTSEYTVCLCVRGCHAWDLRRCLVVQTAKMHTIEKTNPL